MSDSSEGQPSDTQLVPNLAQIIRPQKPGTPAADLEEIAAAMMETLNQALVGFLQSNVQACDQALGRIRAIYERAKKMIDGPEIFLVGAMKSLISMYATLARTQKFLMEGRFRKAKAEVAKGQPACAEGIELLERLFEQSEDARLDSGLQATQIMFPALGKLLSGMEIQIRAEEIGYQGRTREYLEMLKDAVAELRVAAELTGASEEPNVAVFHRVLNEMADRLETRTELFELGAGGADTYLNPAGKKIFIIHGHDEAKWRELMQLLEKEFKIEVIELAEELSESRTIISKFEAFANECCYAFALLTPDDFVKKGPEGKDPGYLQARPNVLFELGWFYGRFGPKRLSIIKKTGTEIPTDLAGIAYIEFTSKVSEAFTKIRDELRQAAAIAEK